MTPKKLFYITDNTEWLNDEDSVLIDMPLWEDVQLPNSDDILSDLMSEFSFLGERNYWSLFSDDIPSEILKCERVDVKIYENIISITYFFEGGIKYIPEREYIVGEDIDEDSVDIFLARVNASVSHLYWLLSPISGNKFSFEYEQWG